MLENPIASTPRRTRSPRVLATLAVVGAAIAIIPFRFVAAEAETRPGRLKPLPALSHAASPDGAHKKQAPDDDRSSYVMTTNSNGDSYVIVHGDEATMNGSWSALGRAKKLAKKGEPIFYAEVDGEEWQIRDRATIAAARALFAEQNRLGEEQGKLGEQQGELGDQQSQLGDQQAELGDRQQDLAKEIEKLARRHESGHAAADAAQRSEALSRQMDKLSQEQERLGELQEELGRKQEVLGAQQEKLGKLQEKESIRVEKEIAALVRRAIDQGLAQRIDD